MNWLKYKWSLLALPIILVLLAWSPWITKDYAEEIALNYFIERWRDVLDGCGFNCAGCGVSKSEKTLFGYNVVLLSSCGFKDYSPTDKPDWRENIFVSFLGTVHTISQEKNLDYSEKK